MELVYIASRYAGDVDGNTKNAIKYCGFAVRKGVISFAPHLLFPRFLDEGKAEERQKGLELAIEMLGRCDALWVFGEVSEGMAAEIKFAKKNGIPMKRFDTQCMEVGLE